MSESYDLIDTHCHIDMLLNKGAAIQEMEKALAENGVSSVVQIASDADAMEFSPSFCEKQSGEIQYYYTIGLHPNEAHELDIQSGVYHIQKNVHDKRFVGIGEVGLDYYYGLEHRKLQMETFEIYLDTAQQLRKPVIVHTRNAHDDTLHMIRKYCADIDFLIHCFSGNASQMKDYLDCGAFISFSGIVTFKNADELRDAARYCPIDRIVVETDSPYLAPAPYRGKMNQPAWVRLTAQFINNLRGEDLNRYYFENSVRFFKLSK
ncbi:MAG: TatD family hydrolase [Spirochaetia bacterium]|nr:TatD family hydrolase [Spirochaetia bacterium]